MPLEEHDLGPALRDAAEMYGIDVGPLLRAGTRRGLRLRRRRRIALASGTALVLALAGTGLGYGTDLLRSPTFPASPRPAGGAAGMSGRQILDLLTGLLPHGKITQTAATGAGAGRPTLVDPYVSGVFDDGHGPAQISFSVVRAHVAPTAPAAACGATSATYRCTWTLRSDGSSLSLSTQTGKPGPSGGPGITMRGADLITPSGYEVRLFESNSASALMPPPAADDHTRAPVSDTPPSPPPAASRPEPPLDAAQLTAVVTDRGWARLFAAMRSARPDHQLTPAQVAAIAKPLLPAYATPANAANQEGLTAFHLGSPEQDLGITALRYPGDEARREAVSSLYRDARHLPDGTLIHTEQQQHRMLVRALHPDGMSVEVIEESLDIGGIRPRPLTTAQLQAIATDAAWDRPAPEASAGQQN
jgi:hypothetical protein